MVYQNKIKKLVDGITAAQYRDAMLKNGYTQGFGTFFRFKSMGSYPYSGYIIPQTTKKRDLKVENACAMGQAALNLCPDDWTIRNLEELASLLGDKFAHLVTDIPGGTGIVTCNDTLKIPVSKIAEHLIIENAE